MLDQIRLKGMPFFGYHGVFPEEQSLGQRFVAHVTLHLDLRPAGIADDITQSVNYAEVYGSVKRVMEGESVQLLERLAERVSAVIFDEYSLVQAVDVEIEKPGAPIPGIFEQVSVCIHRDRYGRATT